MSAPTTTGTATSVAARVIEAVKEYGTQDPVVRALDGVSLEIPANRFTAIMGPSGSGKSTLLHCLAGLDALTSGQVFVGDTEVGALSDRERTHLRRDRIGFVFQAFNLVPTLSAEENITLPLRLARRRPDTEWLQHVVDSLGVRERLEHRPSELSGGQQQRVALARALVGRPELIVADEPTGNLDSASGAAALDLLARAVEEMDQTVAMVTHDSVAAGQADRVVFLADGQLSGAIQAPTARTVLEHLKQMEAA